ncbi:hypothetical protein TcG_11465 [Trypanosoma cruzi]|nr:hypothetical protein TcG_11465 [Trypanosoma cruzi]
MAITHALVNVTLSLISRRQRGQAAEKTHFSRRRQTNGMTTCLFSPSSMRVSVPQQCPTDPLPHGTPRHRPDIVKTGRPELCGEASLPLLRCGSHVGCRALFYISVHWAEVPCDGGWRVGLRIYLSRHEEW